MNKSNLLKIFGSLGEKKTLWMILFVLSFSVVVFLVSFRISVGRILISPKKVDFTQVSNGEVLQGKVTLRNIQLRDFHGLLQVSCSCLKIRDHFSMVLAPFEKREIHFSIDSDGMQSGNNLYQIIVRAEAEREKPIAIIPITLFIQQHYALYRTWADFGRVRQGEKKNISVVVYTPKNVQRKTLPLVFSNNYFSIENIHPPEVGNENWIYQFSFTGSSRLGLYESDVDISFSDFSPRSLRLHLRAEVVDKFMVTPNSFRFSDNGSENSMPSRVRVWSPYVYEWSDIEIVNDSIPVDIIVEAIDKQNLLLTASLLPKEKPIDGIPSVVIRSKTGKFSAFAIPVLVEH